MTTLAINRRTPSMAMLSNLDTPVLPPSPAPLKPVSTNNSAATNAAAPQSSTSPLTASGTGSLYHLCRSVLDRLACVEGMTEHLEAYDKTSSTSSDPLTKLTSICQQGFPLCTLYNALKPAQLLSINADPNLNARNSCKASVYHFIVACRKNLLFAEEDMFTISDLYQDDTNGFVKVVNTINKLLQILEYRGIITVRPLNRYSDNPDLSNTASPKNTRDKVVLELLETERKYVQDMEILQNYMRELQLQKVVSPDTIHYLFGNLNALVDFQRRFLIQLEEIAEKAPEEQRIGHLFIQLEDAFSVYEPYCANYYSAQDLVVQETPRLQKLADILNPTYELPSLLIKPVQRICKYPLLLQELMKSTDKNWSYFYETEQSVDAIKRVTEKVNETQRQHENVQAVQDLKKRLLDDTKEELIDGYGSLMLQDKLSVISNANESSERELHVFLFEKALLFCKESKGSNLLPKSNTLSITKKKRRGSLVPKIIIQASSLSSNMSSEFKNNVWYLNIDLQSCEFTHLSIKYRNEEQLKLWESGLQRAIKKAEAATVEQFASVTNDLSAYTDGEDEEEEDSEEAQLFFDDEEDDYLRQQQKLTASSRPLYRKLSQSNDPTIGRPYQNVPGMNLSPLPRSPSHIASNTLSLPPTTTINGSAPHFNYPGHYPVSPPPSNPSSPIHAARVTSANTSTLSSIYRQQPYDNDYATSDHHYNKHSMTNTGRSQSHSAVKPSLPVSQNRLRSQSSPNIMKNNGSGSNHHYHSGNSNHYSNVPPPMTPSSSTVTSSSIATASTNETLVNMRYHNLDTNEPKPPVPPLDLHAFEDGATNSSMIRSKWSRYNSSSLPPSPGTIKIKLNFNGGIYVIVTQIDITFSELVERVNKKIRLILLNTTDQKDSKITITPDTEIKMRYQDEDGDYITLSSDEDIQMAFESRSIQSSVNLFVST
ncbi:hypothetical protein BDF20DRAFT_830980 [Mycotypha africana]|uniref:uncharacterized protein n=1 Tax=Mycotypha africana TaxID=64632 RepID=UPI002300F357|nr:uncharacterized protein BDF20DRAFT_830980 [Mycotypha africana]KAI8990892.1 hypothetical protein BDF20DRAFT_830980 [Mycotypha africana]